MSICKNKNKSLPQNQDLQFVEKSHIYFDWKITSSSNGSLTVNTPIFDDIFIGLKDRAIYEFCKRIIDFFGSLFAIILLMPMMFLIAIVIKITSKGPILFKQKRVGRFGEPFTFLKFRSMKIDSDDQIPKEYVTKLIQGKNREINFGSKDDPLYKIEKDPRITKFGSFLRKSSLDELPQLFNVLVGQPSLVGPRPPIPYEVEHYQDWH